MSMLRCIALIVPIMGSEAQQALRGGCAAPATLTIYSGLGVDAVLWLNRNIKSGETEGRDKRPIN